jgi:protein O-GlcNAc transferase
MAQLTLQQAIEIGLDHHRAGRLRHAQEMYEQVLRHDPENVDGLHLLGVLAHHHRDSAAAVRLISKAIALSPDMAVMHYNLSEAMRAMGRNEEALVSLRRAVELEPSYVEAQNNLSVVLYALGQYPLAADAARRAIELDPESASPHNNLANALRALGETGEAIEQALRALELRADFPEALNNLGLGYARQERFGEAIVAYRRAIKLKPDFAEAYGNLGAALARVGKSDEAIELFQRAIRIRPGYAEAYNNLAGALRSAGQFDQAILCYEKAISLKPAFAEAMNNLGLTLKDVARHEEAMGHIRRAIELRPDLADAHYNLGVTLKEQMRLDEASEALGRALQLDPVHFGATSALGIVRMEQGRHAEAMELMRDSLRIRPEWQIHSNLCLLSNYHPGLSGLEVLEEHRRWATAHGGPAGPLTAFPNDRSPQRRLRIGYVSPDFRSHAVSHFIEPILTSHDREQFDVYCYAHVASPDPITHLLQKRADHWREIVGRSDQEIDRLIREDQVDILVDLAGHTAHNRLAVFGRRPAPVQVSMIGYPSTTGLQAMDYKIADAITDPPGAERFYTERLLRLEGTFWCFRPLDDQEEVGELPARSSGHITFGSVNNFAKITPAVLDLWARIVAAVPGSRLHLQTTALGSQSTRRHVLETMRRHGVGADQLSLTGWTGFAEYIDLIRTFDLALDPFPFNGGTTTCHLLFYGVPIIALAGERQVSRMGASMLNAVGLSDLVAESADEYLRKAVQLARDLPRLDHVRRGLRPAMLASPLCDAIGFTRKLEAAYREIWRAWCSAGL